MEEDDVFEIERILDTRVKKGIRHYFVRWKGYGEDDDTWEPEGNLDDCEDVLKEFWEKNRKRKDKRERKHKLEPTEQDPSTSPASGPTPKKRGRKPRFKPDKQNNPTSPTQVDKKTLYGNVDDQNRSDSDTLESSFSVVLPVEGTMPPSVIEKNHADSDNEEVMNSCEMYEGGVRTSDSLNGSMTSNRCSKKPKSSKQISLDKTSEKDISGLIPLEQNQSEKELLLVKNIANSEDDTNSKTLLKKEKMQLLEKETDVDDNKGDAPLAENKTDSEGTQSCEELSLKVPLELDRESIGYAKDSTKNVNAIEKPAKDNKDEEGTTEASGSQCYTGVKQQNLTETESNDCEMKVQKLSLNESNTSVVGKKVLTESKSCKVLNSMERSSPNTRFEFVKDGEFHVSHETKNPASGNVGLNHAVVPNHQVVTSTSDSEKLHKDDFCERNNRNEVMPVDCSFSNGSNPDVSKIFNNLRKIKEMFKATKPLLPEPQSTINSSDVKTNCSPSDDNEGWSRKLLEKNVAKSTWFSTENEPKQSERSKLILSPVLENLIESENRRSVVTPETDVIQKNKESSEQTCIVSQVKCRGNDFLPPFLTECAENDTEEHYTECSLELEHFSPSSSEGNSSSETVTNKSKDEQENISSEDIDKHSLSSSICRTTVDLCSPDQESSVDYQDRSNSNGEQCRKWPQVIVISEDSESTDGEAERRNRNLGISFDSRNSSAKYGPHKRKKEECTTESVGQKNNQTKKLEDMEKSVEECDVVSQIIESSSLQKSGKRQTSQDADVERHDSDMDLCDSDFEFDLDDYNPVELETNKTVKRVSTDVPVHIGVPSAIALRDVKKAIKKGDCNTVLASLAGGLDIESQDGVLGMTLLMRAVTTWQDGIVKILISRGANVNARDNSGNTPLMLACDLGLVSTALLLLEAEADVNAKQPATGETALIKACAKGFETVVSLLVGYGADCRMRNQSGLTASQTAEHYGHYEIRDLLDEHNKRLQSCVEKAIISCLGHESSLISPPLLPYVCLHPNDGQKFTYHFNCSSVLLDKTVLLYCLRAVFSKAGEVNLSFSRDNGVHTISLNGLLQKPVLKNNRSVFKLLPKVDTNRLVVQTYQSHVQLLVCIYAADLDHDSLKIEQNSVTV